MNIKELSKQTLETIFRACPAKVRTLMKEVPVIEALDYPSLKLDVQSWLEYQIRRNSCSREPGTVEFIHAMQPGDVLYDVGANVGVYSLIAARCGHPVHAFEPMGVNFGTLLRNIQLNRLSTAIGPGIQPWMIALSDETGTGTFHIAKPNGADHIVSGAGLSAYGKPIDYLNRPFEPLMSYQVISYRLEDFVHRYGLLKPTHIKIDVDGIEFKVLKGCRSLLSTVKSLVVELENEDKETQAIHEFLAPYGLTKHIQHRDYENVSNWVFSR